LVVPNVATRLAGRYGLTGTPHNYENHARLRGKQFAQFAKLWVMARFNS